MGYTNHAQMLEVDSTSSEKAAMYSLSILKRHVNVPTDDINLGMVDSFCSLDEMIRSVMIYVKLDQLPRRLSPFHVTILFYTL